MTKRARNVSERVTHLKDKKAAAAYLGISCATLERLIRDPGDPLPFIKLMRSVKFRPSDLDAYIERHLATRTTAA
jgi:excisionase family DNA binding protein